MISSRLTSMSLRALRALPVSAVSRRVAALPATQTRTFSRTTLALADKESKEGHSAESYFKDVDSTPPVDSTVHRVDSSSEAVQRPYEPPSGQYSQAGVETEEYRSTEKSDQPYDAAAGGENEARYGATPSYKDDPDMKASKQEESPAQGNAGGRKPEGKA